MVKATISQPEKTICLMISQRSKNKIFPKGHVSLKKPNTLQCKLTAHMIRSQNLSTTVILPRRKDTNSGIVLLEFSGREKLEGVGFGVSTLICLVGFKGLGFLASEI